MNNLPVTHDSPIEALLPILTERNEDFPARAINVAKTKYGMLTVGNMYGSLYLLIPLDSSQSNNCIKLTQQDWRQEKNIDKRIHRLSKALQIKMAHAKILKDVLTDDKMVVKPLYRSTLSKTTWFLGCEDESAASNKFHSSEYIDVSDIYDTPKHDDTSRVLLPQLNARIGSAYDQGQRGSCVAQSVAALATYITNSPISSASRQFLFHQCKMIDGHRGIDGTWPEVAFLTISEYDFGGAEDGWHRSDAGLIKESEWPYSKVVIHSNPSHTPPPERVYTGRRWANTSGKVLRCASKGIAAVNDIRALLHNEIPVSVSLMLYSSFQNMNSQRTGRISMPLPGDSEAGGHAMLAVGYDDREAVFLVRNSWGTSWASENPWEYPGHAIMPYRYFQEIGSRSYSIQTLIDYNVEIPLESRFTEINYNSKLSLPKAALKKYKSAKGKGSMNNSLQRSCLRRKNLKLPLLSMIIKEKRNNG